MKKPINYAKYRVRTCYTMHVCAVCNKTIHMGERYHDGGHGRRAHTDCAIMREAALITNGCDEAARR